MTLAPALLESALIVAKAMWPFAVAVLVVKVLKGVIGKRTSLERRK